MQAPIREVSFVFDLAKPRRRCTWNIEEKRTTKCAADPITPFCGPLPKERDHQTALVSKIEAQGSRRERDGRRFGNSPRNVAHNKKRERLFAKSARVLNGSASD
jgi:hypothetical protein